MKEDYCDIPDYLVPQIPEESDWNGIVGRIEAEQAMIRTWLEHTDDAHMLVGLGRYFADRLLRELEEFRGMIVMLFEIEPVFPRVTEIIPMLNRSVQIGFAPEFWTQDEMVKKYLLAKMTRLADSLGFSLIMPKDLLGGFIYIKCEHTELPL